MLFPSGLLEAAPLGYCPPGSGVYPRSVSETQGCVSNRLDTWVGAPLLAISRPTGEVRASHPAALGYEGPKRDHALQAT